MIVLRMSIITHQMAGTQEGQMPLVVTIIITITIIVIIISTTTDFIICGKHVGCFSGKEVGAQLEHVKTKCLLFQYTPFEYTSLTNQILATLPFKT